jgi:hypothetical protein
MRFVELLPVRGVAGLDELGLLLEAMDGGNRLVDGMVIAGEEGED